MEDDLHSVTRERLNYHDGQKALGSNESSSPPPLLEPPDCYLYGN